MNVTIKKGSVVTIPLLAGMAVTSSLGGVVETKMQGASVVVTALVPGRVNLTLQVAHDLSVSLAVTVVA